MSTFRRFFVRVPVACRHIPSNYPANDVMFCSEINSLNEKEAVLPNQIVFSFGRLDFGDNVSARFCAVKGVLCTHSGVP